MSSNRVFILGIDGATFDLLDPWMAEGHLPNFARVAREGTCQPLLSTIPPVSPIAWTSLITGANPGKHGIIDWYRMPPDSYNYIPLCGGDRRQPAVWSLLSQAGKAVGVLNVPMSYPPEKLNGVMVSGMDTPPSAAVYTYPAELAAELKTVCGQYVIDIYDLTQGQNWEDSIKQLEAMLDSRKKALFHLLRRHPWDFFMAVFVFADRLQHALWSSSDPKHPFYTQEKGNKFGQKILEYYKKMDAILGELLQEIGPNTNLFMVSDHGFGPVYKGVSLNKVLLKMGVLKIDPPLLPKKREIFSLLKKLPGIKALQKNPLLKKVKGKVAQNTIDWAKTKAYTSMTAMMGGVHINLRGLRPLGQVSPGREYEELREAIIKELQAVRDPQTGVQVFSEIYKKEEVYSGDYLAEAPDLWAFTHKMEYRVLDSYLHIEAPEKDDIVMALPSGMEAYHRRNGILMAWGPDVTAKKETNPADIIDVAPTVMHLMGAAVPQEMDGKVLQGLLKEEFVRQNPVRFQKAAGGRGPGASAGALYTEQDLEKIQERLKGMGYLT